MRNILNSLEEFGDGKTNHSVTTTSNISFIDVSFAIRTLTNRQPDKENDEEIESEIVGIVTKDTTLRTV